MIETQYNQSYSLFLYGYIWRGLNYIRTYKL